jgi:hypothetical protein
MQPIGDTRLRRRTAHIPVVQGTADGKTRISCAGAKCVAWQPRPCKSRREAQFWFDTHVSQSLIHQLW